MSTRLGGHAIQRKIGIVLLFVSASMPFTTPTSANELTTGIEPVSHASLDTMRGGFVISDNVKFSFLLSSQTTVNGVIQAQSDLAINDLGINGSIGSIQNGSMGTLVQNGPGNTVADSIPLNTQYINVIQNSLDQTFIQNSQNLMLKVQGIGGLQTLGTNSSLTHQIIDSLR